MLFKNSTFITLILGCLLLCSCQDKKPTDSISLTKQGVSLLAYGGEFTVAVQASDFFTVEIPENANWISLRDESADGTYSNGELTFTVSQNTDTDIRQGVVTFRCGSASATLNVTQNGLTDSFLSVFMNETTLGLYTENSSADFIYQDYVSQYSIHTPAEGNTFNFRILTTNPAQYLTVSDVPVNPEEGKSYTLSLTQNYTFDISSSSSYEFSVEKISENTVWLYNSVNRYGLILTTE